MKDDLGDRMKMYEGAEAQRRLDSSLPLVARLDGRSFSKFSKGFTKPFDHRLTAAMDNVTKALVDETHADIGYTQSDEITLIWDTPNEGGQRFFDDRIQKLCSVLASKATAEFHWAIMEQTVLSHDPFARNRIQVMRPHFDCRIWNVPDRGEAANALLWRCQDAKKNAVSIYARQHLSHKQMQGLDQKGMLDAAYATGAQDINAACSTGEIFGRYFQRVTKMRTLPEEARLRIPEDVRPDPGTLFERSSVERLDVAYFGDVGSQEDRIKLIFGDTDAAPDV